MRKFAIVVESVVDSEYYKTIVNNYYDLMEDAHLSIVFCFLENKESKDITMWIPMFNAADLMSFDGTIITTSEETDLAVSKFAKTQVMRVFSPEEMLTTIKG